MAVRPDIREAAAIEAVLGQEEFAIRRGVGPGLSHLYLTGMEVDRPSLFPGKRQSQKIAGQDHVSGLQCYGTGIPPGNGPCLAYLVPSAYIQERPTVDQQRVAGCRAVIGQVLDDEIPPVYCATLDRLEWRRHAVVDRLAV